MRGYIQIVALLAAILLMAPALATDDREQIDVIYISRFASRGFERNRVMTPDPSVRILPVPMPGHHQLADGADINVLNRYMRIYFPRNYDSLVSGSDLVVFFEAPCGLSGMAEVQFDPKWMSWLIAGVEKGGLSLMMMGGDACWGGGQEGSAFYKSWGETMLDRVLPFTSLEGTNPPTAAFNRPRFLDPEHPLNRLPWGDSSPVELLNKVQPKSGATMVAVAEGRQETYPWIAYWDLGMGRVVGETQIHWSKETVNVMFDRWEWYPDFTIYLTYFAVEKAIPDEIALVHKLRGQFGVYALRISLLVSLLEFVEDFGANTVSLYHDLDSILARQAEAEEHYRRGEYQVTSGLFTEIDELWELLDARALRAKENSLVWVYLIEWLTVSGVSLAAGAVLWMIMVNRRLYREVATTRMA